MQLLLPGQRIPIEELTTETVIGVSISLDGNKMPLAILAFMISLEDRVEDEYHVIGIREDSSPCRSVSILSRKESTRVFRVDLDLVPPHIGRIVFAMSLAEGAARTLELSQIIRKGSIRLFDGATDLAETTLHSDTLTTERAILLGELYRKGNWRFCPSSSGYRGGMQALFAGLNAPYSAMWPVRENGQNGSHSPSDESAKDCLESASTRKGSPTSSLGQSPRRRHALPYGAILNENYEIRDELGAGSFGITYLAFDKKLNRLVAIKELMPTMMACRVDTLHVMPNGAEDEVSWQWAQTRFMEEAQALAACEHPNILHVYETFQENGTAYMVTRFVEGCNFTQWLKRINREVTERDLKPILLALLDALQCVHQKKFLHRDIKPDNIYITANNTPILLDFGSARLEVSTRSVPVTMIVSEGFAPFESYAPNGKQGDWTDIYALGAVMYSAIAGEAPPSAIARYAVSDDPCLKLEYRFSQQFGRLFLRAIDVALQKEIRDRHQSAFAWRQMLTNRETTTPTIPGIQNDAYFITRGGESYGPYPIDSIHEYLTKGQLTLNDLASKPGMDSWKPLSSIIGLPPPPPLDPKDLDPCAGRIRFGRLQYVASCLCLFGGVTAAAQTFPEIFTAPVILAICYAAPVLVSIPRMRDIGHSGWVAVLLAIPVVNLFYFCLLVIAPRGFTITKRGDTFMAISQWIIGIGIAIAIAWLAVDAYKP